MRPTAPACSARAAPGAAELLGVDERVDLRMGTFSKSLASCGGFVAGPAEVIDYLRISSRAFLFTASAVPAAVGAALAALRVLRSDEGPPLLRARARERALSSATACTSSASRSSRRSAAADGAPCGRARPGRPGRPARRAQTIVTPIVPMLVGDDWKAALLWRALYDAGVFINCALHPAVPPGGALLRTSVMATHDTRHARPRAGGVRARQARVRGRARAAAGPRRLTPRRSAGREHRARSDADVRRALARRRRTCPILHKSRRRRKRSLLAYEAPFGQLTAGPALA